MHGVHKIRSPAPVTTNAEVAEAQRSAISCCDATRTTHNLLRDKTLRTESGLVIEEDAGAGEQPVSLAIVCHRPVGRSFGYSVRAARGKRCPFVSRDISGCAKALSGAGAVESKGAAQESDRLEEVQRTRRDTLQRSDRLVERKSDRALAGEIVDFVRTNTFQHGEHSVEVGPRHRGNRDLVAYAQTHQILEPGHLRVARRSRHAITAIDQ